MAKTGFFDRLYAAKYDTLRDRWDRVAEVAALIGSMVTEMELEAQQEGGSSTFRAHYTIGGMQVRLRTAQETLDYIVNEARAAEDGPDGRLFAAALPNLWASGSRLFRWQFSGDGPMAGDWSEWFPLTGATVQGSDVLVSLVVGGLDRTLSLSAGTVVEVRP